VPFVKTGYDDWIWDNPNLPNKVNEKEDIKLVIRADVFTLVVKSLFFYIVFFLFLIGRVFISGLEPIFISGYEFLMWGVSSLMIVNFIVIFHNYYLSMQIITNERVIDIDQTGIFKREINTVPITNIQDVTFKRDTFLKSILNYGDIIVQTSGQSPKESKDGVLGVVFNNVPRPAEVKEFLLQIKNSSENEKTKEEAEINAQALKKVLGGHILGS
jgi:uncharacterized membrane protein YdbT with pleckstrin-like domain